MSDKILEYPSALCNQLKRLAIEAGEATLEHFDEGMHIAHDIKADNTPVSAADRAADNIIRKGLKDIAPSIPLISEEDVDVRADLTNQEYFWLVDPLDGTRGFVHGNPDYTVNIALIKNGTPIIGVIYAPALGELYAGHGPGTATRWLEETDLEKEMTTRRAPKGGITAVVSNYKGKTPYEDAMLEQFKIEKVIKRASSIKFCMVAAGKADLYVRFKEISEWDTAAGHAIVTSAGGQVLNLEGEALIYGNAANNFNHPGGFQVVGEDWMIFKASEFLP